MEDETRYDGAKDRGGNQPTDPYDRKRWLLSGLPGVLSTKPSHVHVEPDGIGHTETFIVQTFRQRDGKKSWDTVFLKHVGEEITPLVLPDAVVRAIIRQHDALTDKARSEAAKEKAKDRAARGIVPFKAVR